MKIEIEGKQLKGVFVMSDKSKQQYEKDKKWYEAEIKMLEEMYKE